MLNRLIEPLDFQSHALMLRAARQRVLASNIANGDTPGFVARDVRVSSALQAAAEPAARLGHSHPAHIAANTSTHSDGGLDGGLDYAMQAQPAMDRNTVDLDRERANFADNTVRIEAALRFLGHEAKTMLGAIQGQ